MWALQPKGCTSGLFTSAECCVEAEELHIRYMESVLLVPWVGLSPVVRWVLCMVPSPDVPFENRCSWFPLILPVDSPLLFCNSAEACFLHTQCLRSSAGSGLSVSLPEGIQVHLFHSWGNLVVRIFRCMHWVQVFQKMWKVLLHVLKFRFVLKREVCTQGCRQVSLQ